MMLIVDEKSFLFILIIPYLIVLLLIRFTSITTRLVHGLIACLVGSPVCLLLSATHIIVLVISRLIWVLLLIVTSLSCSIITSVSTIHLLWVSTCSLMTVMIWFIVGICCSLITIVLCSIQITIVLMTLRIILLLVVVTVIGMPILIFLLIPSRCLCLMHIRIGIWLIWMLIVISTMIVVSSSSYSVAIIPMTLWLRVTIIVCSIWWKVRVRSLERRVILRLMLLVATLIESLWALMATMRGLETASPLSYSRSISDVRLSFWSSMITCMMISWSANALSIVETQVMRLGSTWSSLIVARSSSCVWLGTHIDSLRVIWLLVIGVLSP